MHACHMSGFPNVAHGFMEYINSACTSVIVYGMHGQTSDVNLMHVHLNAHVVVDAVRWV